MVKLNLLIRTKVRGMTYVSAMSVNIRLKLGLYVIR